MTEPDETVLSGIPTGVLRGRSGGRWRGLAAVGWMAFAALAVGCGLITFLVITSETGLTGLISGTVLALVPVAPVIGTYLWLDRFEAEPPSLLVFVFAWGAGVATFGALVINTASSQAIRAAGGSPTVASIVVAPVVEEGLKGLAVLLVLLLRRREFDGIVDGLVYAGMVGVGFAFVENVLYLGRALAGSGERGEVAVFVLRCVVSPFAHPLFTSATGVGLGIASRMRRRPAAVGISLAGYAIAVVLHGAWNLSASTGLSGFVSVYVVFQLPIFIGFAVLAVGARRREGRLIAGQLAVYADRGWFADGEVAMLASLRARRRARNWARAAGGRNAERAMRDFQDIASELAFLRERMLRGAASDDAQEQELTMLTAMSRLRGRFVPRGVDPGASRGY